MEVFADKDKDKDKGQKGISAEDDVFSLDWILNDSAKRRAVPRASISASAAVV